MPLPSAATVGIKAGLLMDERPLDALPWDIKDPWIEHRRVICLVGLQGTGKSRLGNLLAGTDVLPEGPADGTTAEAASASSAEPFDDRPGVAEPRTKPRIATTLLSTAVDFEHHFKLGDVCYRVIDTAALQEPEFPPRVDDSGRQLVDPNLCPNGVDCFLYVCRWDAPFTCTHLEAFETFEAMYGSSALPHTAFAFTHLDDLSAEEMRQELESSAAPVALRVCLSKAGGPLRAVGVEGSLPADRGMDSDADSERARRQRAHILLMVDELVRNNAFTRYNNAQIRRAKEWRSAMEREIKFLSLTPLREQMRGHLLALLHGKCSRQQVEQALAVSRREMADAREKQPQDPGTILSRCCSSNTKLPPFQGRAAPTTEIAQPCEGPGTQGLESRKPMSPIYL